MILAFGYMYSTNSQFESYFFWITTLLHICRVTINHVTRGTFRKEFLNYHYYY